MNRLNVLYNEALIAIPFDREIKDAVFSLSPHSAPGPDGFSGLFFQHCWDIIAEEFCKAIKFFFLKNWILPGFNSNFITLIPKTPNVDNIGGFRPIALANFAFKVIPKILSDRLALIAPKIISQNQTAFIRGRSIHHSIGLASECFNLIDRKAHGGMLLSK